MSALRTRPPTGQVAWPLILVEGGEKTGKSVAAYSLSADPRVGRTFVLDVGEGTADEYARLGPYEVIEHNGTYSDMLDQLRYACKEPHEPGVPNVVEIDAGDAVWNLIKDWTNHRARSSKAGKRKLAEDPDAEIDPAMNLWNDARDRWYRIINLLRRSGCIGVLVCRARETALVKDGQPVAGQTDYKVEAEKGTPFAVTAQVRMSKPHTATLVAVRSLDVDLPKDGLRLPDTNPLGHLVFEVMGCGPNTVAANITHATLGLSIAAAKGRLLELVTRLGAPEPKTVAAALWTEFVPAGAEEISAEVMAELLDEAAARFDQDTTEKGAGVDGPVGDGDAAESGDGPFNEDYIRRNSQVLANGCWRWTGFVRESGYGRSGNSEGSRQAHRLAYEVFVGPVPDGHQVDHCCHTEAAARGECDGGEACPHRACVNPDHLEAVTAQENVLRGNTVSARHAAQTHCVNGHPFDEKNTRVNSDGERACRACDAKRQRDYRAAHKQDSHDVGRSVPEPAPATTGNGEEPALHGSSPNPSEETEPAPSGSASTATSVEGAPAAAASPAPSPDPEDQPGAATALRQQAEEWAEQAARTTKADLLADEAHYQATDGES